MKNTLYVFKKTVFYCGIPKIRKNEYVYISADEYEHLSKLRLAEPTRKKYLETKKIFDKHKENWNTVSPEMYTQNDNIFFIPVSEMHTDYGSGKDNTLFFIAKVYKKSNSIPPIIDSVKHCIHCHEDTLQRGTPNISEDCLYISQPVLCENCGRDYLITYKYSGITKQIGEDND